MRLLGTAEGREKLERSQAGVVRARRERRLNHVEEEEEEEARIYRERKGEEKERGTQKK